MSILWDNIKKGIIEGIQTVSEKTEEMTNIGRLKIQILATKRDIEKNFIELGGRIYQMIDEKKEIQFQKDKQIQHLVTTIRQNEKKLENLKKEIERIRKEDGVDLN